MTDETNEPKQDAIIPYIPSSELTTSVPTTDGSSLDVTGWGTRFFGGPSFQSLPRITPGQPKDKRFRKGSDQLFVIHRVRATDENGKGIWEDTFLGPFGQSMIVRPIGINLPIGESRLMMPYPYNPADKALCRSNNGLVPDAEFMDVYSDRCQAVDAKTNRLKPVCPKAKWTTGPGDRRIPPPCTLSYLFGVAFEVATEGDGGTEWLVAELRLKSTGAPAGRNILMQLGKIHDSKQPIYLFPIEVKLLEVEAEDKTGNSLTALLRPDLAKPVEPEIIAELKRCQEVWMAAQQASRERALRGWGGADDEGEGTAPVEPSEDIRPEDIPF